MRSKWFFFLVSLTQKADKFYYINNFVADILHMFDNELSTFVLNWNFEIGI